jgi:hypothetical protein
MPSDPLNSPRTSGRRWALAWLVQSCRSTSHVPKPSGIRWNSRATGSCHLAPVGQSPRRAAYPNGRAGGSKRCKPLHLRARGRSAAAFSLCARARLPVPCEFSRRSQRDCARVSVSGVRRRPRHDLSVKSAARSREGKVCVVVCDTVTTDTDRTCWCCCCSVCCSLHLHAREAAERNRYAVWAGSWFPLGLSDSIRSTGSFIGP